MQKIVCVTLSQAILIGGPITSAISGKLFHQFVMPLGNRNLIRMIYHVMTDMTGKNQPIITSPPKNTKLKEAGDVHKLLMNTLHLTFILQPPRPFCANKITCNT